MQRRAFLATSAAALLSPAWAADTFPSRVVRVVVPFAAGGGFDAIARPFAEKLSAELGQPVIVDNKPGAGGNIGVDFVIRSPADGYTLLFANSSLVTQPLIQKNRTYNATTDLAAISRVGGVSTAIAINPRLPVTTLRELVEYSKKKPLTFGTPGVGTAPHLVGELMNLQGTMRLLHVPYKGTAPAITDAIGGQIDMVMVPISATAPHIRAGKLRGIAVLSPKRSPLMPELPSLGESGLPDVQGETWYGLFAPAKTPRAVIDRLNAACASALAAPDLIATLQQQGYSVGASSPDELTAVVRSDHQRWEGVIRSANIQVD